MNSLQLSLGVLALILVLGIETGSAIKCHVCNSHPNYEGEKCADPMETDEYLTDCSDWGTKHNFDYAINATMCRKQVQKVQGEYRTIRSCAKTGRTDRCVERTGTKEVKITYCECEGEDGCNTASSVFSPMVALSTALMALFAMVARS